MVKGKHGEPFFLPFVQLVASGELEKTLPREEKKFMDGQNILYLFDYGDMWRFRVRLEEIRIEGTEPGEPDIIDSRGESPEQYGGMCSCFLMS